MKWSKSAGMGEFFHCTPSTDKDMMKGSRTLMGGKRCGKDSTLSSFGAYQRCYDGTSPGMTLEKRKKSQGQGRTSYGCRFSFSKGRKATPYVIILITISCLKSKKKTRREEERLAA